MPLDIKIVATVSTKAFELRKAGAVTAGLQEAFLFDVLPRAQDLTPFRFGTNKRSIKTSVKGQEAEIHTESGYGGWLEVGTTKMSARPYLRPAVEENIDKIAAAIKKRL